MKYKDMDLSEQMKASLEKSNYETPTEIQEKSIPLAMQGKDILGQAQTGTGKTAAFAIPIIENTVVDKNIQHLIMAPTRELASQIMDEFKKLGQYKGIKVIQIIGGIPYKRQTEMLKRKPQIIVGTPGRIKDYLEKGKLKVHTLKSFTLDEVDQLLSIGFLKDIEYIDHKLPRDKQNFFFSATLGKKVTALANKILNDPAEVKVSSGMRSTDTVDQKFLVVKQHSKYELLKSLLKEFNPYGTMIFCRTKRRVSELIDKLKRDGFDVDGIQGDMEQRVRSRVIKKFRDGKINIIVGTDVLARGIDVDTSDYVFNYDLPEEIENYTHRIGRVGRAGREGHSVSFVMPSEKSYMNEILKMTHSNATQLDLPEEVQKLNDSKEDRYQNRRRSGGSSRGGSSRGGSSRGGSSRGGSSRGGSSRDGSRSRSRNDSKPSTGRDSGSRERHSKHEKPSHSKDNRRRNNKTSFRKSSDRNKR